MERKSEFHGSKYLESNSNYFNNKYITFFKNLPKTKTSKCRMVLKKAHYARYYVSQFLGL